ncbi:hypothetical protein [Paenirhodobacter populi]|nr:hypothetical protein [Sinirhodobacter populi]
MSGPGQMARRIGEGSDRKVDLRRDVTGDAASYCGTARSDSLD